MLRAVKLIETGSRRWLSGAGGGMSGELLCNGYGVSVWEDEKVLEMDSVDRLTTMWIYLMTVNSTLKKCFKKSIISQKH